MPLTGGCQRGQISPHSFQMCALLLWKGLDRVLLYTTQWRYETRQGNSGVGTTGRQVSRGCSPPSMTSENRAFAQGVIWTERTPCSCYKPGAEGSKEEACQPCVSVSRKKATLLCDFSWRDNSRQTSHRESHGKGRICGCQFGEAVNFLG